MIKKKKEFDLFKDYNLKKQEMLSISGGMNQAASNPESDEDKKGPSNGGTQPTTDDPPPLPTPPTEG